MRRKDHVTRCEKMIGNGFNEVHAWLDEYAKQYPPDKYDAYHRHFRHHKEGIDEVMKKWGPEAALAAALHIYDDWGFIPDKQFYCDSMGRPYLYEGGADAVQRGNSVAMGGRA